MRKLDLGIIIPDIIILIISLIFACDKAAAQIVGQNGAPNETGITTLKVESHLVTESITVKDRAGHIISGLTVKNFTLTEDGVPQTLRFCESQDISTAAEPMSGLAQSDSHIKIYRTLSRSQIAPEQTNGLRYKDRRLMALYFDQSSLDRADQYRSLQAAQTFIRTEMTTVDLVSILRFSNGSVDVLEDFTSDRSRLLSILATMAVGENQEWSTGESGEAAVDNGAAFGQDDSEFNVFNTDRQLSALQTAANMLGHLDEKKVLIYFSGGLRLNGIDNQAQLHATVDAAIRAGVSLWTIDARGLVANAPLGAASRGSPGGIAMYSGNAEQSIQADFAQSQDTLFELAGDTGGKALLDSNDLARGIKDAQQSISSYYVLGYYTTNTKPDGRFRHIKITADTQGTARLEYRQGYYASKEFGKFTVADKERQLEEALRLDDPITDLTIALELDYFQLNRAEYFVPMILKIPGRELALAKHHGADHSVIDFIGEVKDVYGGSTVSNVRDSIDLKFTNRTESLLAESPVEYDAGFTLLPGTYRIKILARDDQTGRIGTYETLLTIPNLNREMQRIPISSVVLSAQSVDLKSAMYNAMKSKNQRLEASVNPLVIGGSKLIPSVTRVFNKSHLVYVYLQGYELGAEPAKPLVAYVSLYRDGARQYISKPLVVAPEQSTKLKVVPLSFNLSLNSLMPGIYDCQVSVLDPSTGKSSFWRAKMEITGSLVK